MSNYKQKVQKNPTALITYKFVSLNNKKEILTKGLNLKGCEGHSSKWGKQKNGFNRVLNEARKGGAVTSTPDTSGELSI